MDYDNPQIRKAAILVASVDPQTARALIGQLLPDQVQQLEFALTRLGDVDPTERDQVMREFAQHQPSAAELSAPPASTNESEDLGVELSIDSDGSSNDEAIATAQARTDVQRAAPDVVASHSAASNEPPVLEPVDSSKPSFEPTASRLLNFLDDADEQELAQLLRAEHPQTAAVIIAQLAHERAAAVLSHLPPVQQTDVVRRMVHMDETHPEVLRDLEAGLVRHLHGGRYRRNPGRGAQAVREILEAGGNHLQNRIVANVRRRDAELADSIDVRQQQLAFEDLFHLTRADCARVIGDVHGELLAVALLDVPVERTEQLLSVLPRTQAMLVRQRIGDPGPIRLEDIQLAQDALRKIMQSAAEQGRIHVTTEDAHLDFAT